MPGDFDPQKESAALQGAVERVKRSQGQVTAAPSELPLFRTDLEGNLTDRNGRVIRKALPPLELKKK